MEGLDSFAGSRGMTAVTSHSSAAELEGRYKTVGDPIAKSHFHATWLLARNCPIGEVTEILLRRCGTWVMCRDAEPDTTVFRVSLCSAEVHPFAPACNSVRQSRGAAVRNGRSFGAHPEGLVLDGREHGCMLGANGAKGETMRDTESTATGARFGAAVAGGGEPVRPVRSASQISRASSVARVSTAAPPPQ